MGGLLISLKDSQGEGFLLVPNLGVSLISNKFHYFSCG